MSIIRSFHALGASAYYKPGFRLVTDRHYEHEHIISYARRILYRFKTHVHPYSERLVSELITKDIDGLEALDTRDDGLRRPFFSARYRPVTVVRSQTASELGNEVVAVYSPQSAMPAPTTAGGSANPSVRVDEGLPVDEIDFDYAEGAYSVYNWELFYHVPFTLALHLSKNGRYPEAQRWFHYIFDPTGNTPVADSAPMQGAKRFWKVKPFQVDEIEHIEQVLFNLATGDDPVKQQSTVRAISAWRDRPLRPHLVARTRPAAYMYATVMAYLDNLIAWGDSLFRQDTRETINEAMQCYVSAANILGSPPQSLPSRGTSRNMTYAGLKKNLDEFGNAAVKLEAELAIDLFPPPVEGPNADPATSTIESIGKTLYFCIPPNEKFTGYWAKVADRLFNIRNSLNLQGVFRQLPLYAPPIDPSMLARAVAAGVDIREIIAGTAAPVSPVRFTLLLQKSLEICQEVKSLGSQILSAIEKKDNETLSVLRAKHETNLLALAGDVKHVQWQESIKNCEGIKENIENAFQRYRYYERLLGRTDSDIKLPEWPPFDPTTKIDDNGTFCVEPNLDLREFSVDIVSSSVGEAAERKLSSHENKELERLSLSQLIMNGAAFLEGRAAPVHLLPSWSFDSKFWGIGPGFSWGGSNIAASVQALSNIARAFAAEFNYEANQAAKVGAYARREQDWTLQANNAAGEINQLYKQLRAAELREHIAEKEIETHKIQVKQSEELYEFITNEMNLRTGKDRKTSTEDFYLWMKAEAQTLHAQFFQFAYEVAKKAERALQEELADRSQKFVQATYLTGREGLFAGEKLYLDLKRMEMAYLDLNKREFEITKHVSLREWFPIQLIALRETGKCTIDLPEGLFDLDCPGHVFRRIKTVAVSIPCITGPYASVNCRLTLQTSRVRQGPTEDDLIPYPAAVESIVTSSAQNDIGIFERNLRDERYLPFEGAGAISTWNIALLGEPRSFNFDSISDVVLTLNYTARDGGNLQDAQKRAKQLLYKCAARLFSMRQEFSSEWARFLACNPSCDPSNADFASLKFELTEDFYPYQYKGIGRDQGTEPKKDPLGKAKRMHLFFVGEAGSEVKLLHNGSNIGDITNPVSGITLDKKEFERTGVFELRFACNKISDLWIIIDWTSTENS